MFYLAITREGRRLGSALSPRPKDAFDAWGTMLYYLGVSKERPKFGPFSYAEKAEYWALVWGTALMAVTGVMMWAKVLTGNLLARWWVDVATSIHFYGAILATLAIVVWHFYQVLLDPDVYPMNWAWWDGKTPIEHYRHEHELDIESLGAGPLLWKMGRESRATNPAIHLPFKNKCENGRNFLTRRVFALINATRNCALTLLDNVWAAMYIAGTS